MWLNLKNTKLSKRSQQKRVYTILSRNQINDYLRMELSMVGMGTEKAMAPHSTTLAWRIPWMEEPGGLQSMGSRRVGYD